MRRIWRWSICIWRAARPAFRSRCGSATYDVPCLFVTGKAPGFPMPDLALGCLMKPFTAEDVHRSLGMAEDMMRGRETLRPKMPDNLTLYDAVNDDVDVAQPGFIPSRRSFKTRLEHWIAGHQA